MQKKTLYQKIWDAHKVREKKGENTLLYIDLHLVHEVTSPQAFEGLRLAGRKIRRAGKVLATMDHNVPTKGREQISDPISKLQIDTLSKNCNQYGLEIYDLQDIRQGIVHVIAPEQGYTLPGMTIVCGDSHTSTHGAFGCLAFGIGTSEVEHVLATQTLQQNPAKSMKAYFNTELPFGTTAKDMTLALIHKTGTGGGTGYVIEYMGPAIESLSMEGRMTVCNMAIEGGAKAGMIAPDEKTFEYLKNKTYAPKGENWQKALDYWKSLHSDEGVVFDKEVIIKEEDLMPYITWGTNPAQSVGVTEKVPDPNDFEEEADRLSCQKALEYMGLKPYTAMTDIRPDVVFIGSCTNSRIEDLRIVADAIKGKKVADNIQAIIVPGSGLVKKQAEKEGLNKIFQESGFEWRDAGCSMCLGMNDDQLKPHQRCASTSNRNFEGRQGKKGRTHLVSPIMAAAAAIHGHFVDVRQLH